MGCAASVQTRASRATLHLNDVAPISLVLYRTRANTHTHEVAVDERVVLAINRAVKTGDIFTRGDIDMSQFDRVGIMTVCQEKIDAKKKKLRKKKRNKELIVEPCDLLVTEAMQNSVQTRTLEELMREALGLSIRGLAVGNVAKDRGPSTLAMQATQQLLTRFQTWQQQVEGVPYASIFGEMATMFHYASHAWENLEVDSKYLQEINQAFDLLDKDRSGTVDMAEVMSVSQDLKRTTESVFSSQQMSDIFSANSPVNANGQQTISKHEFTSMFGKALNRSLARERFMMELVSGAFVSLTLQRIGALPMSERMMENFYKPSDFAIHQFPDKVRILFVPGVSLLDEVQLQPAELDFISHVE
eukprot:TRINITY_DN12580_c0_g7_i1.p1 TRINITY_DN12580_c0_g7~~TRINITY_DN12580_c0_g7_i1.p1  ORF type:complete len:359 (+),score=90.35 TRINITY_DN12580_c0_g7_i1:115-1191(+)